MRPAPKLLANIAPKVLSRSPDQREQAEARLTEWVEAIKKQARANIDSGESIRIAWTARFKIPRHARFDDYTPEEALLEMFEQYFFETPDSVELKGIHKRRNPKTGYSYYSTGDPLLDQLEEAFGRGEAPDMSVLNGGGGRDVFREPVFIHSEAVVGGVKAGTPITPQTGMQGVQETAGGAKITAGGAKVTHTDFSSDEWLAKHLEDDVALRALMGTKGASGG